MSDQIILEIAKPGFFEQLLLSRRRVKAHLHSMHPANRPTRPAALGPVEASKKEENRPD